MDETRFDALSRRLSRLTSHWMVAHPVAAPRSRRQVNGLLAGLLAGLFTLLARDHAAAGTAGIRRPRKKRRSSPSPKCLKTGRRCSTQPGRGGSQCGRCCTGYAARQNGGPRRCACRPAGKRCTKNSQCCQGPCRQGRCGDGGESCPRNFKRCDGACVPSDVCCESTDCPADEVCGGSPCGCVPNLSTCLPTNAPCDGFDCSACCDPSAAMLSCGIGLLCCGFSQAGAACGPGVECAGSGSFAHCVCGRCCIESGVESSSVGGDCSTCCSGACAPSSTLCA